MNTTPQCLTVLPVRDIIRRYLAIQNGILNYYSFVDNRLRLKKLHWILKESLKKTISVKYKLNKNELLRRFGKDVYTTYMRKDKSIVHLDFRAPSLKRNPMKFLCASTEYFKDPLPLVTRYLQSAQWDNLVQVVVQKIQ